MTINSVQKSSKPELSSWGKRPFKVLLMHPKNIEIFQNRFFPSDVAGHFSIGFYIIAGEAGCNKMLERTFFANFGGPATWESTFRPWLRRHSARTRPAFQRVQACPSMSEPI